MIIILKYNRLSEFGSETVIMDKVRVKCNETLEFNHNTEINRYVIIHVMDELGYLWYYRLVLYVLHNYASFYFVNMTNDCRLDSYGQCSTASNNMNTVV